MDTKSIIELANSYTLQRLLTRHFSARMSFITRKVDGATFVVEPSRHRTGLPADAAARRYVITHVAEGWSVVARTVWLDGRLLQPAATHTRIDHYFDDDGRYSGDKAAVAVAFNAWLKGVGL